MKNKTDSASELRVNIFIRSNLLGILFSFGAEVTHGIMATSQFYSATNKKNKP